VKKISSIAAIIAAPTLIASIYGMNFTDMPELDWSYGYPMALAAMGVLALALGIFFRRIRWL
jgi:magnesium transporter